MNETQDQQALQEDEAFSEDTQNPVEDLQNSSQTEPLAHEQSTAEKEESSAYTEENSEMDAFLNEAMTTKADEYEQEVSEQKAEKMQISPEEATKMAVTGVMQSVGFVREQTGKDIKLSQSQIMLSSTLFVPAIMKYGPMVQQYLADMAAGVDEDSNLPEYLAAGGVCAVGSMMYLKGRKAPPINKEGANTKGEKDGD